MNNSKKTFTTFLIVFATMLLSFWVSDAFLGMIGHFIVLDRISIFIVVTVAFTFALVKACSGFKVSEVMLALLLLLLVADGVGIIGFSLLSANYMTALFLVPLLIVTLALLFTAISRRSSNGKHRRGIGKHIAILVFSLLLLALVGFSIVYFHAERLITLKSIQKMQKLENIDFRALLSVFEVGFDLNRTILVISLALSSLAALVSSVRHKGRGYGTLAFLLGLFIFDGIGICWFAFRTGDYLTGTFLIPLMMVAFSLVIGYVVHRVSGWTPDGNLLGKALLAFALVFLAVFMVAIGFYYVKSNSMPDEVFLNRELQAPGVVEFGASESLGRGSLAIPTVIAFVTALFLFIATKLSEAPYRKSANEIPWQILLMIEGLALSSTFISIGCLVYGILGPILLGISISFLISSFKRKRERNSSRAFIPFYAIFLLVYVGGLLYFRGDVNSVVSLPVFLESLIAGTFCSILTCWALRFLSYRRKNRESIKVLAILIAIISLFILCFFGYQLRMNPPQVIEEDEVIMIEEPSIGESYHEIDTSDSDAGDKVTEDDSAQEIEETPVVDVDATEPEPECEIVEVSEIKVLQPSVPVIPPKAEASEVELLVPTAPQLSVAESTLVDYEPRVPSAPTGLTCWGWTYDDDWSEDDWSEDDWVEEDTSEDDFWADFYIAGEDELEMDDGLYYVNVFINGDRYGEWEIYLMAGDPGLPTEYLAYYLEGELIEEVWERIFFDEESPYVFLSHLEEIGITTEFDREKYEIHLDFGTDLMPVRSISIAGASAFYKPRVIAGAMPLEPAKFVLNTRYNLNVNIPTVNNIRFVDYISASLGLSNTFRIMDWYGSFGLYFNFGKNLFDFDFGSWTGHKDIPEKQLRFAYGNIGGANSLGFKFDHDINFGGKKSGRSVMTEYITIEVESDVKVFNEGKEIFRRRMNPGNYKLEDFTLFTGANKIRIEITPLDGSEIQVIDKDILYSTGMLMPGDYNYGLSVNMGKRIVDNKFMTDTPDGVIVLPWINDSSIIYDFRQIGLRGYFNTGITPSLSINTGFSLGNNPLPDRAFNFNGDGSIELTHANVLGTTRYNFNIKESMDKDTGEWNIPGVSLRIGHQTSFDSKLLSSLNMSASYSSPQSSGIENRHAVSLSLGTGGRLGFLSWNLSTYVNMISDDFNNSAYSVSLATALITSSSFSLSASMNVGGTFEGAPTITGRITGSFRFKGGSVNASTDLEGFNAGASASYGKHSFSLNTGAVKFADPAMYTLGGAYSYSGNLFSFGMSFNLKDRFTDASISMNASTSSTFADGLMAFGSSIPQNFLMISQKGAIKGNEVSVASIGSSSSMVLPTAFGVSLYAGISPYGSGGFTVYSTPKDTFGSSVAYDISLVPRSGMSGYVLKLREEPSFNITGIAVNPAGEEWINGSSPVYNIHVGDDGLLVPEITEEFIFTDETGRFIFNELKPGLYGFDIDYEGDWYLLLFEVESVEKDAGKMIVVEPTVGDVPYKVESPYSGIILMEKTDVMEGDEFWAMLFPEF